MTGPAGGASAASGAAGAADAAGRVRIRRLGRRRVVTSDAPGVTPLPDAAEDVVGEVSERTTDRDSWLKEQRPPHWE